MLIFIMNGRGASGKTTFETMVQSIAAKQNIKVEIISTIDYVKGVARTIGWDGGKTNEDRRFLSDLKDALTRWKDIPYQMIATTIKNLEKSNDVDVLFIDCREPKEIQRFVSDYNALTVIVQRGEFIQLMGNHADDEVMNYQYDITIDNSRGLKELQEEAEIFVDTFLREENK